MQFLSPYQHLSNANLVKARVNPGLIIFEPILGVEWPAPTIRWWHQLEITMDIIMQIIPLE